MAKSKDDIKYGTAQARLSEDEEVRVRYKHGTVGWQISNDGWILSIQTQIHNYP